MVALGGFSLLAALGGEVTTAGARVAICVAGLLHAAAAGKELVMVSVRGCQGREFMRGVTLPCTCVKNNRGEVYSFKSVN